MALVLDVGTTGVKAFVFDQHLAIKGKAYRRLKKQVPHRGWVEQSPDALLKACIAVLQEVVTQTNTRVSDCVGLGITNQRETTILWDNKTGKPVYPAIVWEDQRTKKWCRARRPSIGQMIRRKTGLELDSYFSASKIRWILDHVPSAKHLLAKDRLAFGTVDTWLLWNLCQNHPHLTDETNAARTLLFSLKTRQWDNDLLNAFTVPASLLPNVLPSKSLYGKLDPAILGQALPVGAICGDQQASMYAAMGLQGSAKRTTKATYGTGIFVMQSLGKQLTINPSFFTTLLPSQEDPSYVLEAKIEGAAKAVDRSLKHPESLQRCLLGLAKKVDLLIRKLPHAPDRLIIDGGITRDGLIAEIQSRVSGIPVIAQPVFDGTALGVARLLLAKK